MASLNFSAAHCKRFETTLAPCVLTRTFFLEILFQPYTPLMTEKISLKRFWILIAQTSSRCGNRCSVWTKRIPSRHPRSTSYALDTRVPDISLPDYPPLEL